MKLYFNEHAHKYTDGFGNKYISATTLIGNYTNKFSDKEKDIARACSRIGKNPRHPKYLRYKNKSAKQILAEWEAIRNKACDIGNTKHDYLEHAVKDSNGFSNVFKSRYEQKDKNGNITLFTVEDLLKGTNIGELNLDYFIKTGVKDKYPKIYEIIKLLVKDGWKIYSEIGVFDSSSLVSGLIDILFIKGKDFIILDWKTNKDDIKFESGYWAKDNTGKVTNYVFTDEQFKPPLNQLPQSVGNKYTLQLSLYDYLVELFGFNFITNILCHITHDVYGYEDEEVVDDITLLGKNKVKILSIKYLKQDIINMVNDYVSVRTNGQLNLV